MKKYFFLYYRRITLKIKYIFILLIFYRAYDVATQNDLWEHLTKAAQESHTFDNLTNVKEIMNAWTTKMGFPVINVTRDYTTNQIEFAQSRFTFIAPNQWRLLEIKYDEVLWWVPISYTTSKEVDFNNTKPKDWIRGTEKISNDVENLTNNDWIIVNIQGTGKKKTLQTIFMYFFLTRNLFILLHEYKGYYRVNYDERNWQLLVNYLQDPQTFPNIASINRAQILDDALTLARAGKLDYRIALNLTKYLVNENDYVPWRSALGALSFIDSMMSSGSDYGLFKVNFIFDISFYYKLFIFFCFFFFG